MEEIMSMIFNGISLVKALEFSSSSQESPEALSNSLGLVSTLFGDANERLKIFLARRNAARPNLPEPRVRMFGSDQLMTHIESGPMHDNKLGDSTLHTAYSTPRPRRKKKEVEETVLLAAASMGLGTMDIPSHDNYTWRKYGQKAILGSKFPRAYYRCTHQKLYKCPAKKQVQRLDEDPYMFRITYRGSHTCHFFTTSPVSTAATTTTTTNVQDRPAIVNMAETLLNNDMDSIVPLGESYFDHCSLVPGDGNGDWDT